ncbi:MAG: CPBP family intramembrane metalloprotease [Oscillospiraceae bacterium]|nr:CPBP family intramembrane metalloprotease [Oscillospiraceae bacterium]
MAKKKKKNRSFRSRSNAPAKNASAQQTATVKKDVPKPKSEGSSAQSKSQKGVLPVKWANWLFLIFTVLVIALTVTPLRIIPREWRSVLAYIPVVIMALVVFRKQGVKARDIGFKRSKPISYLLTAGIAIAVYPFASLISSLVKMIIPTLFIRDDIEQALSVGHIVNAVALVFLTAILEEFLIRGCMAGSYLSTGRYRATVLLTALVFGLVQMTATGFLDAFVLGVVAALIYVLTDSIWPCIFFQILRKGATVTFTLLEPTLRENDSILKYLLARDLGDPLIEAGSIVAAAVGLVLMVIFIRRLAEVEKSTHKLKACNAGGGGKERLATLPLIVGVIALAIMLIFTDYAAYRAAFGY